MISYKIPKVYRADVLYGIILAIILIIPSFLFRQPGSLVTQEYLTRVIGLFIGIIAALSPSG